MFSILTFLSGCWVVRVGEEESVIPNKIIWLESLIESGETSCNDLNLLLGDPLFSNESWQLELYYFKHTDFMVEGSPLPFLPITRKEYLYLVIIYDEEWKVKTYDIGYAIKGPHDQSPELKSANAGDFLLSFDNWVSTDPEGVLLYAPQIYTSKALKNRLKDNCKAFITTTRGHARVFLNKKLILNETLFPKQGILSLDLPSGEHILTVKPESPYWTKGGLTKELECKPEERLFIEIDSYYSKPSYFSKDDLTGNIRISNMPSQIFEESYLILYHNGKWVGPDKPD